MWAWLTFFDQVFVEVFSETTDNVVGQYGRHMMIGWMGEWATPCCKQFDGVFSVDSEGCEWSHCDETSGNCAGGINEGGRKGGLYSRSSRSKKSLFQTSLKGFVCNAAIWKRPFHCYLYFCPVSLNHRIVVKGTIGFFPVWAKEIHLIECLPPNTTHKLLRERTLPQCPWYWS
jgi:hypothetical protein